MKKQGRQKLVLTIFCSEVVGDIKIVPLKSPGEKVKKGDVVAEIEQKGKQLKLNVAGFGGNAEVSSLITENNGILPTRPIQRRLVFYPETDQLEKRNHRVSILLKKPLTG